MSKLEPSSMVADKAVHRAIVTGELEAGRRMRIRNLAEKLGTTVMPIGEAFTGWRSAAGVGSCLECGKTDVYSAHTMGFGSGRTSTGLVRIGYVSAGAQCLQGRGCSSSPTSGTCFPCSGAYGPLSVDKLFT